MRIQKAHPEGRHNIANSKEHADKGDHFAKILDEKRKESMPQFNLLPGHQNFELPPAAHHTESVSTAAAPADIERLASEIVDHISTHQANGIHSVEIQFNSQILQGLRVSVRIQQGSMHLTFLTPVTRVGGLLQRNLGTLRSALESKGIRIGQLTVSRWAG